MPKLLSWMDIYRVTRCVLGLPGVTAAGIYALRLLKAGCASSANGSLRPLCDGFQAWISLIDIIYPAALPSLTYSANQILVTFTWQASPRCGINSLSHLSLISWTDIYRVTRCVLGRSGVTAAGIYALRLLKAGCASSADGSLRPLCDGFQAWLFTLR